MNVNVMITADSRMTLNIPHLGGDLWRLAGVIKQFEIEDLVGATESRPRFTVLATHHLH